MTTYNPAWRAEFPVRFLQSLYVPFNTENFSIYLSTLFLYLVLPYLVMILQYSSSNRVKPNNVFVNELFCGCLNFTYLHVHICFVFVVLELHDNMVETIIN